MKRSEEENSVTYSTVEDGVDADLKIPLGYRFIPTGCELILYYLLNKILGLKLPANIITDIDLYMFDPEQLPIREFIHGKEEEAYFFTHRFSRIGGTVRPTKSGYWKTTAGEDVEIFCDNKIVGFKKILVFRRRKGSREEKTNWTINEYRANLNDKDITSQYVVCRIRYKSSPH